MSDMTGITGITSTAVRGFMADAEKGGFKAAGQAPHGDKFFWATLESIDRGE